MVSRLELRKFCNIDYDDGTEVVAEHSHIISVDGQEREIDLCERHYKPFAQTFEAVLTYGTRPGNNMMRSRRSVVPGERHQTTEENALYTCPDCGKNYRNAGFFNAHTASHGGGEPPYVCGEAGCSKRYWSAQSRGSHRWASHGIPRDPNSKVSTPEKRRRADQQREIALETSAETIVGRQRAKTA